MESQYIRDVEKVNGSLKVINERFLKQEADKKILERVRSEISSIATRVEKVTASGKNNASQSTLNTEMISQALGRIKVLEDRDKATKEVHPITRVLLDRKAFWKEMGFDSLAKLENFANDVAFPLARKE